MGFLIFGTFIPYYGCCIVIGIVCAFLLGYVLCRKLSMNTDDFIIICAYLLAFGFAGAKILYIIVSFKIINFSKVFSSMQNFNYFINSGFVFYGGVLGGIIAFPIVKKIHKIESCKYLQCIVSSLCIAHSFGRVGCLLAGCCYGKNTDRCLYFIYKKSLIAPNNVKLIPIQGIEAFFVFLFGIMFVVLIFKKSKIRLEFLYILLYSVLRFVLEFFRGDVERGFVFFLSTSQVISVIAFIIVVAKMIFERKRQKSILS